MVDLLSSEPSLALSLAKLAVWVIFLGGLLKLIRKNQRLQTTQDGSVVGGGRDGEVEQDQRRKSATTLALVAIAGVYLGNSLLVQLPQSCELLNSTRQANEILFPAGYTQATLVFSVLLFISKVLGYDSDEQTEVPIGEDVTKQTTVMSDIEMKLLGGMEEKSTEATTTVTTTANPEGNNGLLVQSYFAALAFAVGSALDFKEFFLLSLSVIVHIAVIVHDHEERTRKIAQTSTLKQHYRTAAFEEKNQLWKSMWKLFAIGLVCGIVVSTSTSSKVLQSLVRATNSGSLVFVATMKLLAAHYEQNNRPLLNFFVFSATTALAYVVS